jgi:hypothetical protein
MSRAIFVGLVDAVRELRKAMDDARRLPNFVSRIPMERA